MTEQPSSIPGYLGRVLTLGSVPVGTCFQVTDHILVTAWHVLEDADAPDIGDNVLVDGLSGDAPALPARVTAIDREHDLAVLVREQALSASVSGVFATSSVPYNAQVAVTGAASMSIGDYLQAGGRWQGICMRDGVQFGRLESRTFMPGMSGGPVSLVQDGAIGDQVIGVGVERYHSSDGWGRDSVRVAQCEHLQRLLPDVWPRIFRGNAPGPDGRLTPRGVPPRVKGFTGREAEFASLLEVLDPAADGDAAPVTLITGLPGIGKTALAVESAYRAVDREWFPGGTIFVDLRGYDETPMSAEQAFKVVDTIEFSEPRELSSSEVGQTAEAACSGGQYYHVLVDRGGLATMILCLNEL